MKRASKPRAVIDTNLLISAAIAPKGLPNKLIRVWQNSKIILVISPQLIQELEEVAQRDKFKNYHLFKDQSLELVNSIKASAEVIPSLTEEQLSIHSRDLKDDKLLACAISSEADYLVTGDEDLLILKDNSKLGPLRIVTVRQFLKLFE